MEVRPGDPAAHSQKILEVGTFVRPMTSVAGTKLLLQVKKLMETEMGCINEREFLGRR